MPRPKSFSMDDAARMVTGLFLQRGCRALSMRELAAALNLSRSTIYLTWGGKEGLFAAVLDRYGPPRAPGADRGARAVVRQVEDPLPASVPARH